MVSPYFKAINRYGVPLGGVVLEEVADSDEKIELIEVK